MLGMGLLGLHELGEGGLSWVLVDVLWASLGGIAIGIAAGVALAHMVWKLHREPYKHDLMDDFLGLGLIGVVYGFTVLVHAWGFLAVFFAAVALRQTELKLDKVARDTMDGQLSQEILSTETHVGLEPMVSKGSLVFKEHLERLSEVVMILLIGGALFLDSWSWRATGLALFLFVVARPISTFIGLLGTHTTWQSLGMTGWFGVRGIGSLYYLMYAIQHGLPETLALELIQMTLIVVTLSILLHGISVKPLMSHFWRHKKQV
jgi:NhaP-type Na+/H+ or K+/H+ antiporter